jgi:hypothetical protein
MPDQVGVIETRGIEPVHLPAVVAWLVAIVLGVLCTRAQAGDTVWFAGPFADSWIGRNSLGWLVAGVTGAVLYWALRAVAREQTRFPESADAPVSPAPAGSGPPPPGGGLPGTDVAEKVNG